MFHASLSILLLIMSKVLIKYQLKTKEGAGKTGHD